MVGEDHLWTIKCWSYSFRSQDVAFIPRCNSRFMRDSLVFSGSALWNVVNCNDKIDNLIFKEIKRLLTTKNCFHSYLVCGLTPHYICRSAEMKLKSASTSGFNHRIIFSVTQSWGLRLTCPDCNGG